MEHLQDLETVPWPRGRSDQAPTSQIHTVGVGVAMGQSCMLLSAGTKGKRFMLPHATGGCAPDILLTLRPDALARSIADPSEVSPCKILNPGQSV